MAWDTQDRLAQDVALELLLYGPLPRAEIARRLDLSPATLTRVSAQLLRAGVIVETDQVIEGRGRPVTPLDVVPGLHLFLGVKVAHATVSGVITDMRGDIVETLGERSHDGTLRDVTACIASMVEASVDPAGVDAIGIAIGGVVDRKGIVTSAPFLDWHDVDLRGLVERKLGRPTTCANDLEAFTQALHWFGAGAGLTNFSAVTLGAGVGYGCVANGHFLSSPDSGVGLVGHWPLDPFGPPCPQGHRGCADAMLTTTGLERSALASTGERLSWGEIITAASEGDPAMTALVDRAGRALGHLMAAIANLTAPELIVIGGEGVDLAIAAAPSVEAGVAEHRDPRALPVMIETVSGTNDEWCRGAAVAAIRQFVLRQPGPSPR